MKLIDLHEDSSDVLIGKTVSVIPNNPIMVYVDADIEPTEGDEIAREIQHDLQEIHTIIGITQYSTADDKIRQIYVKPALSQTASAFKIQLDTTSQLSKQELAEVAETLKDWFDELGKTGASYMTPQKFKQKTTPEPEPTPSKRKSHLRLVK